MKTISYNEKNLNVIYKEKELNIPVSIYIEIQEGIALSNILKIIYCFDYVLFSHLYQYLKKYNGLSKTAIFERIQRLESYNMIKTNYLNNHKYAMLTPKGLSYVLKRNDLSQKREPSTENLKNAIYISAYFLHTNQIPTLLSPLKEYKAMYEQVYETLSREREFDIKDPDEDFKRYIKGHGEGLRHIQLREKAECAIAKYGDVLYFSSKDYIEEEMSYLNNYISKSEKERRTSERDELSTMQNQYLYYISTEDNVLKFIMFDLGRSQNFYRETFLHLDRIIRRIHQCISKIQYMWEVTLYTDGINRKEKLEKDISKIKTEYLKYKETATHENLVQRQILRNRVQYRKAAFFMKDIKVESLNIDKYFKNTVRDPGLPIQEEQIDIRKL
ncbi:TPA: hypothetical protein QCR75_005701 [Bacillus anthracis]|nr:hypothetical protein [Bacillus anthracis]